jgi:predicted AlkP superfamily phosphohydrolase/phosphomutase
MDKSHYRYDDEGSKKYADSILKAYQKIDQKLGELLDSISNDNTITVLMSDHGAGPISKRVIHLNQYLSEIGMLQFKNNKHKSFLNTFIQALDPLLRKTLTPKQKAKIAKLLPEIRKKWETRLTSMSAIDWDKTKAYCYEILPTYTNVWINLKGKFPNGIVNPGAEYNGLIDFLIERLYELRDPESGKKIIKKIFRKDEMYTGPYTDIAPDLLLNWWEDEGFTIRPSSQDSSSKAVRILDKGFDKLINQSGTHRLKGIFLLNGPPFKNIHIADGTNIVDLAPTLLYLMGCPVPDDMDGKIIEAAFKEEYLKSNPIKYKDETGSFPGENSDGGTYSEEEAEIVKKRLTALGYMD